MSERRRGGDRGGRTLGEPNGYAEIDPTGRYGRFDEVLGKGAMKTVYKAFDSLNGTEVAWNQARLCSVLESPHELQRLYSEVHLLRSFHHECIIKYHASWIDVDKRTFNFITEMFTSGTLREYRQRYPGVDIRAIKSWARQILHGLVYLHGHDPPVIHRDIKCDNIFINGHLGQVKIGDFGLAAVLQGSESAHSVIGTPEFMAPELYEEEYNELVDVYSFGLCVLEMLTCEYPYSECFNPAQIYKKVTKGKLPDAFYRIQDSEAKRFISRCLGNMSNRLSAKELLLDPFLDLDDHDAGSLLTLKPIPIHGVQKNKLQGHDHSHLLEARAPNGRESMIDMTITGKRSVEDGTIFLKVQIFDKQGHARNIYFPFDTASDTPMDVANEMVKELEIADREPSEIAEMIAQEVSLLVPDWKVDAPTIDLHHVYNYKDDPEDGCNHPFYNDLSSPTSSQGSVFGGHHHHHHHHHQGEQLQDEVNSTYSAKSSLANCTSNQDQECKMMDGPLANEFHKQCQISPEPPSRTSRVKEGKKIAKRERRLTRNWSSSVDVRSLLLHRNLLEQLKKRLFKTVGAVENVGFQKLCGGSRKPLTRSLSLADPDCRKLKQQVHEQGREGEDFSFREHM